MTSRQALHSGDRIYISADKLIGGWGGYGIVEQGGYRTDDIIKFHEEGKPPHPKNCYMALRSEVRKVPLKDAPDTALIRETLDRLTLSTKAHSRARLALEALMEGLPGTHPCYAQTLIPAWWGNTFWYKVIIPVGRGAWVVDTCMEFYSGNQRDIRRFIAGLTPVTYAEVMTNWQREVLWEYQRPLATTLLKAWCHQHNLPYTGKGPAA